MIYVFGDSHAWKFTEGYSIHSVAALTVHGFCGEEWGNSPDVWEEGVGDVPRIGREIYARMLEQVTDDDVILFVLGEVDCRIHFFYHHMREGTSVADLINNTVRRYGTFLEKQTHRIAVLDVPPAIRQENVYGFPYYGTREQRAYVAKEFNRILGEWCREHGVPFIEIYPYIVDEHGFLKDEYAAIDDAHLMPEVLDFIEAELKKSGLT